jgi:hypothetical protein
MFPSYAGRGKLSVTKGPDSGEKDMTKKIILAAMTLCILGTIAADARPHRHKVCFIRHHHRICRWA